MYANILWTFIILHIFEVTDGYFGFYGDVSKTFESFLPLQTSDPGTLMKTYNYYAPYQVCNFEGSTRRDGTGLVPPFTFSKNEQLSQYILSSPHSYYDTLGVSNWEGRAIPHTESAQDLQNNYHLGFNGFFNYPEYASQTLYHSSNFLFHNWAIYVIKAITLIVPVIPHDGNWIHDSPVEDNIALLYGGCGPFMQNIYIHYPRLVKFHVDVGRGHPVFWNKHIYNTQFPYYDLFVLPVTPNGHSRRMGSLIYVYEDPSTPINIKSNCEFDKYISSKYLDTLKGICELNVLPLLQELQGLYKEQYLFPSSDIYESSMIYKTYTPFSPISSDKEINHMINEPSYNYLHGPLIDDGVLDTNNMYLCSGITEISSNTPSKFITPNFYSIQNLNFQGPLSPEYFDQNVPQQIPIDGNSNLYENYFHYELPINNIFAYDWPRSHSGLLDNNKTQQYMSPDYSDVLGYISTDILRTDGLQEYNDISPENSILHYIKPVITDGILDYEESFISQPIPRFVLPNTQEIHNIIFDSVISNNFPLHHKSLSTSFLEKTNRNSEYNQQPKEITWSWISDNQKPIVSNGLEQYEPLISHEYFEQFPINEYVRKTESYNLKNPKVPTPGNELVKTVSKTIKESNIYRKYDDQEPLTERSPHSNYLAESNFNEPIENFQNNKNVQYEPEVFLEQFPVHVHVTPTQTPHKKVNKINSVIPVPKHVYKNIEKPTVFSEYDDHETLLKRYPYKNFQSENELSEQSEIFRNNENEQYKPEVTKDLIEQFPIHEHITQTKTPYKTMNKISTSGSQIPKHLHKNIRKPIVFSEYDDLEPLSKIYPHKKLQRENEFSETIQNHKNEENVLYSLPESHRKQLPREKFDTFPVPAHYHEPYVANNVDEDQSNDKEKDHIGNKPEEHSPFKYFKYQNQPQQFITYNLGTESTYHDILNPEMPLGDNANRIQSTFGFDSNVDDYQTQEPMYDSTSVMQNNNEFPREIQMGYQYNFPLTNHEYGLPFADKIEDIPQEQEPLDVEATRPGIKAPELEMEGGKYEDEDFLSQNIILDNNTSLRKQENDSKQSPKIYEEHDITNPYQEDEPIIQNRKVKADLEPIVIEDNKIIPINNKKITITNMTPITLDYKAITTPQTLVHSITTKQFKKDIKHSKQNSDIYYEARIEDKTEHDLLTVTPTSHTKDKPLYIGSKSIDQMKVFSSGESKPEENIVDLYTKPTLELNPTDVQKISIISHNSTFDKFTTVSQKGRPPIEGIKLIEKITTPELRYLFQGRKPSFSENSESDIMIEGGKPEILKKFQNSQNENLSEHIVHEEKEPIKLVPKKYYIPNALEERIAGTTTAHETNFDEYFPKSSDIRYTNSKFPDEDTSSKLQPEKQEHSEESHDLRLIEPLQPMLENSGGTESQKILSTESIKPDIIRSVSTTNLEQITFATDVPKEITNLTPIKSNINTPVKQAATVTTRKMFQEKIQQNNVKRDKSTSIINIVESPNTEYVKRKYPEKLQDYNIISTLQPNNNVDQSVTIQTSINTVQPVSFTVNPVKPDEQLVTTQFFNFQSATVTTHRPNHSDELPKVPVESFTTTTKPPGITPLSINSSEESFNDSDQSVDNMKKYLNTKNEITNSPVKQANFHVETVNPLEDNVKFQPHNFENQYIKMSAKTFNSEDQPMSTMKQSDDITPQTINPPVQVYNNEVQFFTFQPENNTYLHVNERTQTTKDIFVPLNDTPQPEDHIGLTSDATNKYANSELYNEVITIPVKTVSMKPVNLDQHQSATTTDMKQVASLSDQRPDVELSEITIFGKDKSIIPFSTPHSLAELEGSTISIPVNTIISHENDISQILNSPVPLKYDALQSNPSIVRSIQPLSLQPIIEEKSSVIQSESYNKKFVQSFTDMEENRVDTDKQPQIYTPVTIHSNKYLTSDTIDSVPTELENIRNPFILNKTEPKPTIFSSPVKENHRNILIPRPQKETFPTRHEMTIINSFVKPEGKTEPVLLNYEKPMDTINKFTTTEKPFSVEHINKEKEETFQFFNSELDKYFVPGQRDSFTDESAGETLGYPSQMLFTENYIKPVTEVLIMTDDVETGTDEDNKAFVDDIKADYMGQKKPSFDSVKPFTTEHIRPFIDDVKPIVNEYIIPLKPITEEQIKPIIDDVKPITENQLKLYIDEVKLVTEGQKQTSIDNLTPITEKQIRPFIDDVKPIVKEYTIPLKPNTEEQVEPKTDVIKPITENNLKLYFDGVKSVTEGQKKSFTDNFTPVFKEQVKPYTDNIKPIMDEYITPLKPITEEIINPIIDDVTPITVDQLKRKFDDEETVTEGQKKPYIDNLTPVTEEQMKSYIYNFKQKSEKNIKPFIDKVKPVTDEHIKSFSDNVKPDDEENLKSSTEVLPNNNIQYKTRSYNPDNSESAQEENSRTDSNFDGFETTVPTIHEKAIFIDSELYRNKKVLSSMESSPTNEGDYFFGQPIYNFRAKPVYTFTVGPRILQTVNHIKDLTMNPITTEQTKITKAELVKPGVFELNPTKIVQPSKYPFHLPPKQIVDEPLISGNSESIVTEKLETTTWPNNRKMFDLQMPTSYEETFSSGSNSLNSKKSQFITDVNPAINEYNHSISSNIKSPSFNSSKSESMVMQPAKYSIALPHSSIINENKKDVFTKHSKPDFVKTHNTIAFDEGKSKRIVSMPENPVLDQNMKQVTSSIFKYKNVNSPKTTVGDKIQTPTTARIVPFIRHSLKPGIEEKLIESETEAFTDYKDSSVFETDINSDNDFHSLAPIVIETSKPTFFQQPNPMLPYYFEHTNPSQTMKHSSVKSSVIHDSKYFPDEKFSPNLVRKTTFKSIPDRPAIDYALKQQIFPSVEHSNINPKFDTNENLKSEFIDNLKPSFFDSKNPIIQKKPMIMRSQSFSNKKVKTALDAGSTTVDSIDSSTSAYLQTKNPTTSKNVKHLAEYTMEHENDRTSKDVISDIPISTDVKHFKSTPSPEEFTNKNSLKSIHFIKDKVQNYYPEMTLPFLPINSDNAKPLIEEKNNYIKPTTELSIKPTFREKPFVIKSQKLNKSQTENFLNTNRRIQNEFFPKEKGDLETKFTVPEISWSTVNNQEELGIKATKPINGEIFKTLYVKPETIKSRDSSKKDFSTVMITTTTTTTENSQSVTSQVAQRTKPTFEDESEIFDSRSSNNKEIHSDALIDKTIEESLFLPPRDFQKQNPNIPLTSWPHTTRPQELGNSIRSVIFEHTKPNIETHAEPEIISYDNKIPLIFETPGIESVKSEPHIKIKPPNTGHSHPIFGGKYPTQEQKIYGLPKPIIKETSYTTESKLFNNNGIDNSIHTDPVRLKPRLLQSNRLQSEPVTVKTTEHTIPFPATSIEPILRNTYKTEFISSETIKPGTNKQFKTNDYETEKPFINNPLKYVVPIAHRSNTNNIFSTPRKANSLGLFGNEKSLIVNSPNQIFDERTLPIQPVIGESSENLAEHTTNMKAKPLIASVSKPYQNEEQIHAVDRGDMKINELTISDNSVTAELKPSDNELFRNFLDMNSTHILNKKYVTNKTMANEKSDHTIPKIYDNNMVTAPVKHEVFSKSRKNNVWPLQESESAFTTEPFNINKKENSLLDYAKSSPSESFKNVSPKEYKPKIKENLFIMDSQSFRNRKVDSTLESDRPLQHDLKENNFVNPEGIEPLTNIFDQPVYHTRTKFPKHFDRKPDNILYHKIFPAEIFETKSVPAIKKIETEETTKMQGKPPFLLGEFPLKSKELEYSPFDTSSHEQTEESELQKMNTILDTPIGESGISIKPFDRENLPSSSLTGRRSKHTKLQQKHPVRILESDNSLYGNPTVNRKFYSPEKDSYRNMLTDINSNVEHQIGDTKDYVPNINTGQLNARDVKYRLPTKRNHYNSDGLMENIEDETFHSQDLPMKLFDTEEIPLNFLANTEASVKNKVKINSDLERKVFGVVQSIDSMEDTKIREDNSEGFRTHNIKNPESHKNKITHEIDSKIKVDNKHYTRGMINKFNSEEEFPQSIINRFSRDETKTLKEHEQMQSHDLFDFQVDDKFGDNNYFPRMRDNDVEEIKPSSEQSKRFSFSKEVISRTTKQNNNFKYKFLEPHTFGEKRRKSLAAIDPYNNIENNVLEYDLKPNDIGENINLYNNNHIYDNNRELVKDETRSNGHEDDLSFVADDKEISYTEKLKPYDYDDTGVFNAKTNYKNKYRKSSGMQTGTSYGDNNKNNHLNSFKEATGIEAHIPDSLKNGRKGDFDAENGKLKVQNLRDYIYDFKDYDSKLNKPINNYDTKESAHKDETELDPFRMYDDNDMKSIFDKKHNQESIDKSFKLKQIDGKNFNKYNHFSGKDNRKYGKNSDFLRDEYKAKYFPNKEKLHPQTSMKNGDTKPLKVENKFNNGISSKFDFIPGKSLDVEKGLVTDLKIGIAL